MENHNRFRRRLTLIITPLVLLFSAKCFALKENPCRATTYWSELHEVVATEDDGKLHFYKRFSGCKSSEPGCEIQQKSYLVKGDRVLLSSVHPENKNWVCALYGKNARSVTYGWLKGENLKKVESKKLTNLKDLAGTWEAVHPTSFSSGSVTVSGKAGELWKGETIYKDNDGEFAGTGKLADGEVTVEEAECSVTFRLLGPYLTASDNKNCGGLNVTFDGAYIRRK